MSARRLTIERIVTNDAIEQAYFDLRGMVVRDAESELRAAAEREGVTLDSSGPTLHEIDLVFIEDPDGTTRHMEVDEARASGWIFDEPDAVLMRWEWVTE